MLKYRLVAEQDLAAIAKASREKTGRTKTEIANALGVSTPSVFNAEEVPTRPLTKLRCRIIEACSDYKVDGPFYRMVKK